MSELISIVVPIYNVEKYLRKCIDSILAQTYQNLQIILVDDGSKDCSGIICDEYKKKDLRISVIHQENGGLVNARKAGLRMAVGDYVGFVDGDDYIEKEMYQRLLEILKNTSADFVHAGYLKNDEIQIRGTGAYAEIDLNKENKNSKIIELIFDLEKGQIMSPCLCFKLFKREIIVDAYSKVPDGQSYGEDLISLCRAIYLSDKVTIINEGYYHYIVRNDSIMNNVNNHILVREEKLRTCLENLISEYDGYDEMSEAIELYWITGLIDDFKRITPESIRVFNCAFISKLYEKRVVLYGAGAVGIDYYSQIRMFMSIELVAWVDKNSENMINKYCPISPIDFLIDSEYDYVVIAVLSKTQADSIRNELRKMGVDEAKIIWNKPRLTSVLGMEG